MDWKGGIMATLRAGKGHVVLAVLVKRVKGFPTTYLHVKSMKGGQINILTGNGTYKRNAHAESMYSTCEAEASFLTRNCADRTISPLGLFIEEMKKWGWLPKGQESDVKSDLTLDTQIEYDETAVRGGRGVEIGGTETRPSAPSRKSPQEIPCEKRPKKVGLLRDYLQVLDERGQLITFDGRQKAAEMIADMFLGEEK
jgi:hypothetical protein